MAMGFELIAVLNSTLCSMLGPGLALRGPDGSMHRAVDGLMLEYRLTFVFFTLGLVAFHVSALLFAWLEFRRATRCAVSRGADSSRPRTRRLAVTPTPPSPLPTCAAGQWPSR